MFRTHTDVMRTSKQESEDSEEEEFDESSVHKCGYCDDGWTSETEVAIHQATKHTAQLLQLYRRSNENLCRMCSREFPDHDQLVQHIKTTHLLSSETAIRVEREIFACNTCGEIYFNKNMLAHHISYSHSGELDKTAYIECPICLKNVKVVTSWYHFRGHRLQSIACCKICFKKCKNLKRLSHHYKSHAKDFKCEMCGYQAKKAEFFNEHIQSVHKRHVSNVNDKLLDLENYFIMTTYPKKWKTINMMGWRGVKLTNDFNICVLCRHICVGDDDLKQHILLDHMCKQTVVTNYMCSCGMLFTSKVLLKHHQFKFRDQH